MKVRTFIVASAVVTLAAPSAVAQTEPIDGSGTIELEATVGKAAFQPLDGSVAPLLTKWSDAVARAKATVKLRQKVAGKSTGTYRKLVLVTLSTETP